MIPAKDRASRVLECGSFIFYGIGKEKVNKTLQYSWNHLNDSVKVSAVKLIQPCLWLGKVFHRDDFTKS